MDSDGGPAVIGWGGGVRVRASDVTVPRRGDAIGDGEGSGEDERVELGGRSVVGQFAAAVCRAAAVQKKKVIYNVFIVLTPVAVCVALLILQILANSAINNAAPDSSGRCGCRCLRCCGYYPSLTDGGEGADAFEYSCNDAEDGVNSNMCLPSNFTKCLEYDESTCGLTYSTESQAPFCAIENPVAWPPLIQVPTDDNLAHRYAPSAPILYTGDNRMDADAMAEKLLPVDPGLAGSLLTSADETGETPLSGGLEEYAAGIVSAVADSDAILGTSSEASYSLYIEPGFIPAAGQEVDGDGDANAHLTTLFYLLRNCSEIPDVILTAIDAASISSTGLSLRCRDTPTVWRNTSVAISAEIYCGDPSSRCVAIGDNIVNIGSITDYPDVIDEFSTLPVSLNQSDISGSIDAGDLGSGRSSISGWDTDQIYKAQVVSPPQTFNSFLYDFGPTSATLGGAFDIMLWYFNSNSERGVKDPPVFNRVNAAINRASQSYLSNVMEGLGVENADEYGVTLRGLQGMPKPETKLSLDFSTLLGPLFYLWLLQTLLPIETMIVVSERELGLRSMMKIHGLLDVAYWFSHIFGHLVLYISFALSFFLIGTAVQLLFFTSNNVFVQLILYAMWGFAQVSLAALLSTLFSRAQNAMIAATLWVFASGLFASVYIQNLLETGTEWAYWLNVIPSFALYRGLYELSQYAFLAARNGDKQGMSWDDLYDSDNGMITVWIFLAVETIVMLAAALLLERFVVHRHQLPSTSGGCFGALFRRRRAPDAGVHGAAVDTATDPEVARRLSMHGDVGPDIAMERDHAAQSVLRLLQSTTFLPSAPMVIAHKLRKQYGNGKTACADLSLTIAKSECFGLLGPNGAGKTTTIGMLNGQMRPTSGCVFIRGKKVWFQNEGTAGAQDDAIDDIHFEERSSYSRRSHARIDREDPGRKLPLIGLCPQYDRLWPQLSAEEHLHFYGKIRGIDSSEMTTVIGRLLYTLNLNHSGIPFRPVHTYSGGMKRRLSVAIALLGDPDMVFLDEPSSGLDPGSRRALWDAISESMGRGITIMLTTHSMEEAENLCDRIGIFADGSLRCIGSPHELSARYGRFQTLSLTTTEDEEDINAVPDLVHDAVGPLAQKKYQLAGTFKFEVPASDVSLGKIFRRFEDARHEQAEGDADGAGAHAGADEDDVHGERGSRRPRILEWEIKSASLEDVFHAVTEQGATALDRRISTSVRTSSDI